jgi:hypothetical protein
MNGFIRDNISKEIHWQILLDQLNTLLMSNVINVLYIRFAS